MNIVEALHSEEARLERQLSAIKSAIAALNGGGTAVAFPGDVGSPNGTSARERVPREPCPLRFERK